MSKKILLRDLGLVTMPIIGANEIMETKIVDELMKRIGILKSKLNIIRRNNFIILRFNNVELIKFNIQGNSKTGFYLTIEEEK